MLQPIFHLQGCVIIQQSLRTFVPEMLGRAGQYTHGYTPMAIFKRTPNTLCHKLHF